MHGLCAGGYDGASLKPERLPAQDRSAATACIPGFGPRRGYYYRAGACDAARAGCERRQRNRARNFSLKDGAVDSGHDLGRGPDFVQHGGNPLHRRRVLPRRPARRATATVMAAQARAHGPASRPVRSSRWKARDDSLRTRCRGSPSATQRLQLLDCQAERPCIRTSASCCSRISASPARRSCRPRRICKPGEVAIPSVLDLKPALDEGKLDARFLRDLDGLCQPQHGKCARQTSIPHSMIPVLLRARRAIDPALRANSLTRHAAARPARGDEALCDPHLRHAAGGGGHYHARRCQHKGDRSADDGARSWCTACILRASCIDCDAYTGGFNLQIAWATAHAAAQVL